MELNRTLQLAYAFIPSPNPIRASLPESNQNRIDLQVVISNPTLDEINFKLIQIEIPVGDDIAADLSSEPKLPDPDYDTSDKWKIKVDPDETDTILISPKKPGEALKGEAIIFKIPGIKTNTKPGTVMIAVDEDGVEDSDTYSLVKQPSDFPVTKFWAEPAILNDFDLTSKLYWTCDTALGPQYTYNLREVNESWKSLNHQWNEGVVGIETLKLTQKSTTFALDVVKSNPSGHPTIIGTVTTWISVDHPEISKESYMEPKPANHYYRLHWLTQNTTQCGLLLDNNFYTFTDLPPIDTYQQGYPAYAGCGPGSHQFTLVAYGKSQDIKTYYQFPDFQIHSENIALKNLDPNIIVTRIAITKDGALAFVGTNNSIIVLDITGRSQLYSMPIGGNVFRIVITPDKKYALRVCGGISVINIDNRSKLRDIEVMSPWSIAITPDGKYALATNTDDLSIIMINTANWTIEDQRIPLNLLLTPDHEVNFDLAITPDSNLALVTIAELNQVIVVDINKRSVEPAKINVGKNPVKIAITPDGRRALVVNQDSNTVSVIDILQRSEDAAFSVGQNPNNIAITNDGRYAWVTYYGNNSISVIDTDGCAVISSFSVDSQPVDIALTPDNTVIVLKENNSVEYIY